MKEYELDKSTGELTWKEETMTWNYRIMKRKCPETGEPYYALNEVFYKDNGKPWMYSERDDIVGGSPKEVIQTLEIMLIDARKDAPILTEKDFKKKK